MNETKKYYFTVKDTSATDVFIACEPADDPLSILKGRQIAFEINTTNIDEAEEIAKYLEIHITAITCF